MKRWFVRGAALGSAALLLVIATLSAMIVRYGQQDYARVADVIIVLGGGKEGSARRAEHGAALYRHGYAPFVLCTGGVEIGGQTEARTCAQTLVRSGVPESAILLDERSRSTADNARESGAIMARRGWRSAVLVSDNFHLWRARWLYRQQHITVYTSPAQTTTGRLAVSENAYSVLREIVAVGWQVSEWLGL